MAFHILIKKIAENLDIGKYEFSSGGDISGTFKINKVTGDVELIDAMPGDEQGHIFQRAAVKILKEWRKGTLPEFAEWAS